jgi:chemotaxis protein methyltransferase CheR
VTPVELEPLLALVAQRTGTRLSRQQRERLIAELGRRLVRQRPDELLTRLQSRDGAHELAALLAVVSVHKTDLFRDEQQLEALQTYVLRPRVAEGRPLTLWSAGCSTGEEVATLLVLLSEVGAHPESTVLGSDLSADALAQAKKLEFSSEVIKRVPPALLARYFRDAGAGHHRLVAPLAGRARFAHHNLVDRPYPFSAQGGPFDVIVCRNVLIYFTAEAAQATVAAFVERLRPGGVLVLSTAEPLLDPVAELSTLRVPGAFFYVRGPPPVPAPVTSLPPPRPSAPRPRAPAAAGESRPAITGENPIVLPPEEEGRKLFDLVLEWAAAGEDDRETEAGLRKALYLAPRLAAARYLLGLILERRGQVLDAANEYRRAAALLDAGTAASSAFFLNNERLRAACRVALTRLGR